MMQSNTLRATSVAALFTALCAGSLLAQNNPEFKPGDLILAFQNPGGTTGSDKVFLVNIGDTALVFRDATANILNITNIGTTLTSTYGANWWETDTLYMSLIGVWGTGTLSTALQNQDPHRTTYLSRPRASIGTEGVAQSTAPSVANTTDASNLAGNAFAVGGELDTLAVTASAVLTTTQSGYDDRNPFIQPGIQGTAYSNIAGGTQFGFGTGAFGSFGGIQTEGALDLYRLQTRNNIPGQFGQGQPNFVGDFQGTVVITQTGDVSFIVQPIPEPTTVGLLGVATTALLGFRRRRLHA